MCIQVSCSRTECVCTCGSVTVWTYWDRFGWPAAGTRWTVTTAAALMDSLCAPITAARLLVFGAPGLVGHHAVFPVGGAREPDTGEEQTGYNYTYQTFFFCTNCSLNFIQLPIYMCPGNLTNCNISYKPVSLENNCHFSLEKLIKGALFLTSSQHSGCFYLI